MRGKSQLSASRQFKVLATLLCGVLRVRRRDAAVLLAASRVGTLRPARNPNERGSCTASPDPLTSTGNSAPAIRASLLLLALGRFRTRRRRHHRFSRRLGRLTILIVKQQFRQCTLHVPFHVVRQHAEKHMRSDAVVLPDGQDIWNGRVVVGTVQKRFLKMISANSKPPGKVNASMTFGH
jgi:hypothetical protein